MPPELEKRLPARKALGFHHGGPEDAENVREPDSLSKGRARTLPLRSTPDPGTRPVATGVRWSASHGTADLWATL
jgi:hypothetical protein